MQKLLTFALHHLAHRNAGGATHDFGNLFGAHARAQQLGLRLKRLFLGAFGFLELFLELGQNGVLQFGQTFVTGLAAAGVHFTAHAVNFVAHVLFAESLALFSLPDFFEIGILARKLFDFLFNGAQALTARVVGFLFHRLAFDLELYQAAFELIKRFGLGVDFHLDTAGSLINQVNGLIGQVAISDVAVRELGGRHNGRVGDFNAVVRFVLFLQAAQNGNRIFHARLVDEHFLETAF